MRAAVGGGRGVAGVDSGWAPAGCVAARGRHESQPHGPFALLARRGPQVKPDLEKELLVVGNPNSRARSHVQQKLHVIMYQPKTIFQINFPSPFVSFLLAVLRAQFGSP